MVIFWSTLVLSIVVGLTIYAIGRVHIRKTSTGYAGMVGEIATVVDDLNPEGKVMIAGEYWNAIADSRISSGSKVKVTKAENLALRVEPLGQPDKVA